MFSCNDLFFLCFRHYDLSRKYVTNFPESCRFTGLTENGTFFLGGGIYFPVNSGLACFLCGSYVDRDKASAF